MEALTRRQFIIKTGTSVLGMAISPVIDTLTTVTSVQAASTSEPSLYFPDTGHHLSGDVLGFWRRNRNGHIFGLPITEEILDDQNRIVQYFENVKLVKDLTGKVQLGHLGDEYLKMNDLSLDTHSIDNPVAIFFRKYPDILFGPARGWIELSETLRAQVFQNAIVLRKPLADVVPEDILTTLVNNNQEGLNILWPRQVKLLPFGQGLASHRGISTKDVDQHKGSITYTPEIFDKQKSIEIDLTDQQLTAYEGNVLVFQCSVATGHPGSDTPAGMFSVNEKEEIMDYQGWDGKRRYYQPDVPFNMRFFPEVYIHGTYWHDEFAKHKGYGRSVGCVNLDPYDASWLYDWTPLDTHVRVYRSV